MQHFEIGMHVVCINDDPEAFVMPGYSYYGSLDGLTKGIVYTIRDIGHDNTYQLLVLKLEEIIRPIDSEYSGEQGYYADRFRPLRKLNVEDFVKEFFLETIK